jgi:bifunctional DNA-binding transcriptional regulator/antitoxin component of YhaV-PrlF toxin-antitoxin module
MVRLGEGGQVKLPENFLDLLGLSEGDPLLLVKRGNEVVLMPPLAMIARLRQMIANGAPEMVAALDLLAAGYAAPAVE